MLIARSNANNYCIYQINLINIALGNKSLIDRNIIIGLLSLSALTIFAIK